MSSLSHLKPYGWAILFFILIVISLHSPTLVQAAGKGITILSISQQDLNGDGRPDLTVIDCSFFTDHDRIYIFDQNGDMQASTDWRKATDFNNDIWMYDTGANGTVQLIVVYQNKNGHSTALIYDDTDRDGQVKYERTGAQIKILESKYWTAQIVSGSSWFLPDGRVNLNVHINLDGPVPAFDRAPFEYFQDNTKQDGQVDADFEEAADPKGIARYALKRLLAPSPPGAGFERSGLQSNEGHYPTRLPENAFFPFIQLPVDPKDPGYKNLRYFDLPPTVFINWGQGRVVGVGLYGYPIGDGYHMNDNDYIIKGQVNDVSFESPQAYYDLANDHDAFPDMHIRFFTRPAYDHAMWSLPYMEAVPWQIIRYDWNLFNPGTLTWDFKLGVGGNQAINSVVQFPDFALRTIPYNQLPYWVTQNTWKIATFVAREGKGYPSSEGIYEWNPDTGDDPLSSQNRAEESRNAVFSYMQGVSTDPPYDYFKTTQIGFRAESHLASPAQPSLYFSPVDHKLHLSGAESGIWTIDDQSLIRYSKLNGGDYIDQWQYYVKEGLQRQFYAEGPYLLYAGEEEVILKKADVSPALFKTVPPRNHDEWLAMRQQLEAYKPSFAPGDFKAMLTQFPEPEWHLSGATMHDFRPDGNGFRFVLELQPNFKVEGENGPDLANLLPGAYVVRYDGSFHVEKLSPPNPSITLSYPPLVQMSQNPLSISLRNNGLEDLSQASLELWTTSPQGQTSTEVTQTVELPAQSLITKTLLWAPNTVGQWAITPMIRLPDQHLIIGNTYQVSVVSDQAANLPDLVPVTLPKKFLPLVVFSIVVFAGVASLVVFKGWGRS